MNMEKIMATKKPINKRPANKDNSAEKTERIVFAPKSRKQQMILQDNTTKVILCGGGKLCASTLKTTS